MNSATIQARVWTGYGKVARFIGQSHAFYRASAANSYVLDENGNRILGEDGSPVLGEVSGGPLALPPYSTLSVSLNAEDMNYGKPNKYGKATWYALFNAMNAQVGDYLVGPAGTFFIATLQLLLPILVVECNRVVTVFRPQIQTGADGEYGGTTKENENPIMTTWPCSILQGTKGEKNESGLVGDTRSPWWTILLPFAGVQILPNDIITDDQGFRYVVSSPEHSSAGWRITAMTAIA